MRRRTQAVAVAVVLATAAAVGGVVVGSSGGQATPTPQESPDTAKVERGELYDRVSQAGVLTFRARPDGSPFVVINRAGGTYTKLPAEGEEVGCGKALYRADDSPVLLLCGEVPAYRDLHIGDVGQDVRELNRNLHRLGFDADAGVEVNPEDSRFAWRTQTALEALQRDTGSRVTGALGAGDAVFLPEPARIAKVTGQLGGFAQPGAPVLSATSDTPEVQVSLEPSQRDALRKGDRAQITLPDNTSVTGRVDLLGTVAHAPAGREGDAGAATVPAYIRLDHPAQARGLDQAPVQVEITTEGVRNALSVPVTALVGKSGGGFAVEVVRGGGRRELLAVRLGLFDDAEGRVQVEGDLHEGDRVVVPSS